MAPRSLMRSADGHNIHPMVGWSRRNAENRERRNRWWASLSDDEREMYAFLSEVNGPRDAFLIFKTFTIVFVLFVAMMSTVSK
jgi:hypothetical protein